ncbi:MAG: hydroxypyruvate isomerase [Calditrichaeota bacterium]|nr:MAG: hydroxypyruvate isomerase [Calditrichota bacterium]
MHNLHSHPSSGQRDGISRRSALQGIAAATMLSAARLDSQSTPVNSIQRVAVNGRIHHSVSKWCYTSGEKALSYEELCSAVSRMGIESIELLSPAELPILKSYGLTCAIVSSHSLTKGMNRLENHDECIEKLRTAIDAAAENNCRGTISFPGNREGMPDDVGIKNAVIGFKKIVGYAEKKGVTIHIEYLNSKINHKDYMFDNINWGAEVCRQVGSERLKILYDIYHAQIMEGDIIRTIQDYHQYIGHYHTGGVPGRNEIDDTQELYYPAIMKAIVATGYTGFVGQEFVPKGDPLTSLAQAIKICDV